MATEEPESVIERLMGLNEMRINQRPFYKRCRVLSDWYVESAASVGVHQGNQTVVRRSLQKSLRSPEKSGAHSSVSSTLIPNSVKTTNGFKDIKLDVHSKLDSGGSMHRNFQQQKSTVNNPQAVYGPVYVGECYSATKPEVLVHSSPRVHSYYDYIRTRHRNPVKSPLTIESVNRNLEKWKIPMEVDHAKVFKRGQNIDEMLVAANRNRSSLNSRSGRIGRNRNLDLFSGRDKSKKQKILQKDSVEPSDGRGLMQLQLSASILSSGISAERQAESRPGASSMEEKHSSHLPESSSEEVLSLNGVSEKDSTDSCCSRSSSREFQDHLKGNNQWSPASVLQSCEQQKSNFSECFESFDMQLLLQDMDFESDDTYSEGSVMVVSGDEDSVEDSSDQSCDKGKIHKWSDESRDFSYLVDVLDEAGLCSVKSFMDLKNHDAIEYPISNMVFKSLEKKYGKQTLFSKSERHLLFDRINAGLLDIINQTTNTNVFEISTMSCFNEAWKRENIEDVLWKMLLNEEKDKNCDLSTKALERAGKWMELEGETSIICRELESLLFEELVMEFVRSFD